MNKENVFILTGAGISAESNISTYRDKGGLWHEYDPEVVSTFSGFMTHPKKVQEFYNRGREEITNAEPNAAHYAIGQLMEEYEGEVTLVTMNIDDLHERSGVSEPWHMHGAIHKSRCTNTRETFDQFDDIIHGVTECECCGLTGTLRPDVVWFGEMPKYLEAIEERISACDIFVTIGTSGSVAPASKFVAYASYEGKRTYNLNTEFMVKNQDYFYRQIIGPATETVPQFVDDLLAGKM